jgi:N-acetylglutamate synthase
MVDRELIRGLEERLVNVWPSAATLLMEGWAVRIGNGYSGRANSASAVMIGARLDEALIAEIERIYAQAGLPSSVRVTPVCDPSVEAFVLSRGYRVKDRCRIMLLDLAGHRGRSPDPRVRIEGGPSRRWVADVCARQSPGKRNADHLMEIVGRIRVPAGFAALEIDGKAVGFGMCAIDRGCAEISSVVIDPALRGQGLGRATVEALLAWAAVQGARHAFLQVDGTNSAAISLYRSQGFVDIGGYVTTITP